MPYWGIMFTIVVEKGLVTDNNAAAYKYSQVFLVNSALLPEVQIYHAYYYYYDHRNQYADHISLELILPNRIIMHI